MIQLDFDAADAGEALSKLPVRVGYSSHEGAESAGWGDDKLEIVDGTHPVVYPADGSHANKFEEALYLGSSAEAGVGCDDTEGPHREVRPVVKTIPSDHAAAAQAFPWITFEGRWGELQKAFFNGPTGPNLKTQWTEPIEWSDGGGTKLRGARGRPVRDTRDGLLLRGGRAGLARARPAPAEPACRHDLPRRLPRSCDLRHHANDLEPCCSSTRSRQAKLGADPPCLRPHVRTPRSALPRARDPFDPAWTRHLARAGGRPGRLRARRGERLGRIGGGSSSSSLH